MAAEAAVDVGATVVLGPLSQKEASGIVYYTEFVVRIDKLVNELSTGLQIPEFWLRLMDIIREFDRSASVEAKEYDKALTTAIDKMQKIKSNEGLEALEKQYDAAFAKATGFEGAKVHNFKYLVTVIGRVMVITEKIQKAFAALEVDLLKGSTDTQVNLTASTPIRKLQMMRN